MSLYELSPTEQAINTVYRAADLAWTLMGRSLFVRTQQGEPLDSCIPHVSLEAAEHRAELGRQIVALLDSIDVALLPHDTALTARLLRYYAQTWTKDAERYWLAFDMAGVMFYGPFAMTAYTGGFIFNGLNDALREFEFRVDSDGDRYLALLADIARMLRQIHARTEGQAERGIRIHKPQLPGVRGLIQGLRNVAEGTYRVDGERLSKLTDAKRVAAEIDRRVDQMVLPAFDALLAQLDDAYEAQAPDGVGMDKLPGGREVYLDLLKMHTTMDMTAEQVHEAGHERMARIQLEMEKVRKKIGFMGSASEFLEQLRGDPRASAKSADDIGARMRKHKDRIEARFDEFFAERSPNEYDVKRLDEALEPSMTWGFYQGPSPNEPRGLYRYNGSKLDSQAVFGAASLTFHELVPGHHLHLTLQSTNLDLHPIRRHAFVNAFNEGWAEYSATLTGEMGLYDDPYDHYGRLIMDAFLTSRLVVDTGMNALGWSWQQARQYMAEHTLCADAEIASDTLRYSCGIPAQSLAYKLGDEEILRLRQKAMDALGDQFDYRGFHSAILGVGALPLPDLDWHLSRFIEQQKAKGAV